MKVNLTIALLGLIAALHFTAAVAVVPRGNQIFQQMFDTGYPPTRSEITTLRFAYLISFPLSFWIWLFHPARISRILWYSSAIANAVLWAFSLLWVFKFFRRRIGV